MHAEFHGSQSQLEWSVCRADFTDPTSGSMLHAGSSWFRLMPGLQWSTTGPG